MSLRFLADHCIPNSVVRSLRKAGHRVSRLRDVAPADLPDPWVIAKAMQRHAMLISLNGDFADIIAYPPERYRGIVSLQVHDHPEAIPTIMARLMDYLSAHPDADHYVGKLLIVEPHRIRIRE